MGSQSMCSRSAILISIIVILGTSACRNNVVTRDSEAGREITLLTGDPCLPPCWYGIVPGETTIEDVKVALPTLSFVDEESINEHKYTYSSGLEWSMSWLSLRNRKEAGEIWFDETGLVSRIGHYWGRDVELKELIDIYGPPDGLLMLYHPEQWPIPVRVIWFSQGVAGHTRTNVDDWDTESLVQPNTLIDAASYFSPSPDAEAAFEGDVPDDYYEWNDYNPPP